MTAYLALLALAALLPPIFLLIRIWRLDKIEKESPRLLRRLFFCGVLSAIPAVILEILAEQLNMRIASSEEMYLILDNFLGTALVEEGCKYFFLKRRTWRDPEFNYRFDGVVYAVTVSLGFAAIENLNYVMEYGLSNALIRALISIPGHCIFGIFMGYYYGLAKADEAMGDGVSGRRHLFMAAAVPVILHGIFDYLLSTQSEMLNMMFWPFIIVLDLFAIRSVRRFSRDDQPI